MRLIRKNAIIKNCPIRPQRFFPSDREQKPHETKTRLLSARICISSLNNQKLSFISKKLELYWPDCGAFNVIYIHCWSIHTWTHKLMPLKQFVLRLKFFVKFDRPITFRSIENEQLLRNDRPPVTPYASGDSTWPQIFTLRKKHV